MVSTSICILRSFSLCLFPLTKGILTLTICRPQEALGLPYLQSSFGTTPFKDPQCFNITCTLQDVREHSQWHPIFGYGIAGASTTPEDDSHLRNLDMPWLKLDDPEKYTDSDVAKVPAETGTLDLRMKVRHAPPDMATVPAEIRTLEFLLNLPPAKRPYSWQRIRQQEAGIYGDIPLDDSSLANASAQAEALSNKTNNHFPAGHAILRTYNQDVELLPPDYPNTLRTFFRGIVRQQLGDLRDQVSKLQYLNYFRNNLDSSASDLHSSGTSNVSTCLLLYLSCLS
jgi:hypothetical protein